MIPQGGGLRPPPPGGSLHSLATEKFEFRVIALERDFFDLLEICSKPEILYFPVQIYMKISEDFKNFFVSETDPPGKSWKHDFSDIPWTLGPSGPSLDSRAQNSVQDSLNESSVRPNGTPVMPLLHFGHGWLFRSKTTNYLLCKFSYEGNNNYNNQRLWWQEPPGKIMFVLFCFATCRDEEKETQNINVVGKTKKVSEVSPYHPKRCSSVGEPWETGFRTDIPKD